MYAQLGDIVFEAMLGPNQYDDNQETDYAEIPLINRKPRLQRVGEKLQEINLGILLNSGFCIPEEEHRRLNEKRINGEILAFVWGSGDVEGNFVIRSIKKSVNSLSPSGNMREISLQVTLSEYFDPDQLATIKKTAQRNAFATNLDAPTPENIETPEPTSAADLMADVAIADRNTNQVNQKLNAAAEKTTGYDQAIDQAQVYVSQVKSEAYQVKKLIRGTKDLLTGIGVKLAGNAALSAIVPTLSAEITAAETAVNAADTVVTGYDSLPDPVTTLAEANQVLGSMNDSVQAVKDMDQANKNVKKAAQKLAVAMAARKDL